MLWEVMDWTRIHNTQMSIKQVLGSWISIW